MDHLIKAIHKESEISTIDLDKLENDFKFIFPNNLREFFIKYSGAEISLCSFTIDSQNYDIYELYPVKHSWSANVLTVETILQWDRQDKFIPTEMIPFAEDQGGDVYYCDANNGNVVLLRSDNIDNKILISTDLDEFLKLFSM